MLVDISVSKKQQKIKINIDLRGEREIISYKTTSQKKFVDEHEALWNYIPDPPLGEDEADAAAEHDLF